MLPIFGHLREQVHFVGLYHVLGGTLSALDGVGPDDLNIKSLMERAGDSNIKEIILAHQCNGRTDRPPLII